MCNVFPPLKDYILIKTNDYTSFILVLNSWEPIMFTNHSLYCVNLLISG